MEEFDIRVKKIRFQKDRTAYCVLDAAVLQWRPRKKEWQESRDRITCAGQFYGLVVNDHLHVTAELYESRKYGPQWRVHCSERIQPGTEVEMVKFLTSVKGIGTRYARELTDAFGLDVLSRICDDCSILNRFHIPKTARDNLYRVVVENRRFEEILLFLRLHGVPPRYAAIVYSKYGDMAIPRIQDNPYSLFLDDVIGFPEAWRLDRSLEFNTSPAYRINACVLETLQNDAESRGNLYMPRSELRHTMTEYVTRVTGDTLNCAEDDIDHAVKYLTDSNWLTVDETVTTEPVIYLRRNYTAELSSAEYLASLCRAEKKFNATMADIDLAIRLAESGGIHLATGQRAAVETALTAPVSILTGGPGTGKTQTLNMIVQTAKRLNPDADIRICAPTGKAAVRATELTGIHAETIHRLVGFPRELKKENELDCDILIADEFSMADIQLCSWLFRAVSDSTRVVIVGDHEQLPSVGPGLVLRDMINSGEIPVTRLTDIFRQASGSNIILNANRIIDGNSALTYSTAPGGDFYMVPAAQQSKIRRMIQKSVDRLLTEGFDMSQIEVLTPVHGTLIGCDSLNLALQEQVNGGARGYQLGHGIELRLGDKVIQTRNNYELEIFNGETGTVKTLSFSPTKAVEVAFPNRSIWYDATEAEDLDLAYAVTVHKSQGSEFAAVIIPIHESYTANNRSVLYTAITRARERVILIGSGAALQTAVNSVGSIQRRSNLISRLKGCL